MIFRYPLVLPCCDFKTSGEQTDKEVKAKQSQDTMGTWPIQFLNKAVFPMMQTHIPLASISRLATRSS